MSTVKITQLPELTVISGNTSNTILVGVDLPSGVTTKYTVKAIADGMYANNVLNVGNNAVIFPGVVGQFVANNESYVQLNLQNSNGNGSGDLVVTSDIGTDTTDYIDLGIQNSTYNYPGYTIAKPLDGYLLMQGSVASNAGGNLVIGTVTQGKDITFFQGGAESTNAVAKFSYTSGFQLLKKPLTFADGSTQNTSSEGAVSYANSAFVKANAAFLVANTPTHVANSASVYANAAFTQSNAAFLQANSAYTKANNALANTTGIFDGSLTVTGNANVGLHLIVANGSYDYTNSSLVKISGAIDALIPPANPGYMLEVIGINGVASRIINTGYGTGAYGLFAGRHANGTAASPTAAANNDVIARFSGSGYNGSAFTATGQGRIDIVAEQDYTTANNGSRIEFFNTLPNTNTVTKIATFNANTVTFTGAVQPTKGFIYTPNVTGTTTTKTIDFSTDNLLKFDVNDNATITLGNYVAGKVVDVWITNSAGQNKTITHGCLANNSTSKATTFTITSNSCARLKYFSIDGDQANTFVSITA